ncbi:bifunctional hydroxymethylpyrimidine kinase/phosphomethylpyrimidine kinase [Marinitenerispora sediminis]|uniref:Bifunctional hydroxymethylpyrimidine kinase/phosphomethylpyrimidine kinase n=1 Tax=Marinitenerispora sediminis TaxID=1931232 RepID=A0A368T2A1_9ACTN|nr:bifunctional hydroxymethylpyrimidine kinase/phosphomethylpyrimidine kinase [Marinitenerispora sediminis]RCV52737.1 bifunctional hydroxymethylpyrimidine kinase/phosphomethylpyrimidine kinase [Marinitenerispora sediminis]RCV54261.1 bifunctional hydroxymethylpyrimidine kinase/phosphomethylpyrimidine kinase [Marinitenerispora sediminis]RCV54832.1 bifunctional hydroxymethylpyrimidine kinase/phosphomethylpyrimidine kinase [Marinitenerispora sediminis]
MPASRNILSIAGTDPSGGAGIQADLKAFSALGGYGMTVVTALVAQTTTGVREVLEVPPEFVTSQLATLLDDVRVDAVKIGMLNSTGVVDAVVRAIDAYRLPNVVVDPVMVAKSGDRLLAPEAIDAVRSELLPRADLVTPNLPEAAELLGEPPAGDLDGMRAQAERLLKLGPRRVLLKGGHLAGPHCVDLLVGADGTAETLTAERVSTENTHGTGCTLSSAIAALRPRRPGWPEAVREAKGYVTEALRRADDLDVGHGKGPVHHFHAWW